MYSTVRAATYELLRLRLDHTARNRWQIFGACSAVCDKQTERNWKERLEGRFVGGESREMEQVQQSTMQEKLFNK